MANFGFARLAVAASYDPHWREARSAVGAPDLLENAREVATLAEAVASCTFVAGTGTLTHRKAEQKVVSLPNLLPYFLRELDRGGRVGIVFGPEKHGLTREDLSYCHVLVEIPTDSRQPSMNLGQAVAVCLYELSRPAAVAPEMRGAEEAGELRNAVRAPSDSLDRLADLIEETMTGAGYSPRAMQPANRHDLRLLLRRLALSPHDTRRMLGLFRRILHRIHRPSDREPTSD